ncbi:hypothetical protein BD779DRAFT_1537874 [Infundibulicybe gibba]|nr:hypothetical protein BD779DRAFT_1537874 [Infundibulicybe gibba]
MQCMRHPAGVNYISRSAPASHRTWRHGGSSGAMGHTRTPQLPLGCTSDCLCVGMYSPSL